MAGKSPTEKIAELTSRLLLLEATVEKNDLIHKMTLADHQRQIDERKKREDELLAKVTDLTAKNAALEERARGQEKTTDRGFNFVQAAIICVISMVGGPLHSQLGVKK